MFFLAAGDGEETFWIQLLVIVILAAGVGVFGVIKKHRARYGAAGKFARQILDSLVNRTSELRQSLLPAIRRTQTKLGRIFKLGIAGPETEPITSRKPAIQPNAPKPDRPVKRGKRDFDSGMELLTRDFLVEVVERTGSAEMRDVTMRNLCFTELVRRGELWAVSSDALKTYTLNTEGVFDKSIRYQAMKELAKRTAGAAQPTTTDV